MIYEAYNTLLQTNKCATMETSEVKELLLNWLACEFKVQPSFASPWMPIEFMEWNDDADLISYIHGNIEEFLNDLSDMFNLPKHGEWNKVKGEIMRGIPNINEQYPEPVMIHKPNFSHWVVFEYAKNRNPLEHILYITESNEFAHKVSFLLNSILKQPFFNLYYPLIEEDAQEALESIQPNDDMWELANLWKPKEKMIKKAQRKLTAKHLAEKSLSIV